MGNPQKKEGTSRAKVSIYLAQDASLGERGDAVELADAPAQEVRGHARRREEGHLFQRAHARDER